MGTAVQNGDLIARRMHDGRYRMARYTNGTDQPIVGEAALGLDQVEVRLRSLALLNQSNGWIEELNGILRLLD